jgi:hypothetical protein
MSELFTRLTFNSNNWEFPSGHPWHKKNQGKSNIPYENQHGFGHEEWLFNLRYNVDGWQYGYIRGLKSLKGTIEKVHLYTVNLEDGIRQVYYLGILKKVEALSENWHKSFPRTSKVFDKYEDVIDKELLAVNANALALIKDPFVPVIRFKVEEAELLTEPILLQKFPLATFKRFQPYKMTDSILRLFETGKIESSPVEFLFVPGKANQTARYKKYMTAGSKTVIKKHSEIIDMLERFLTPEYSIEKENISIEMTRFNGCTADVVTEEKDKSISIYEVKTKIDIRKNIREAIGQLLDYSAFANKTIIKKLVIVSPCKLTKEGNIFLESIKSAITISVEYLQFNGVDSFYPNKL